MHSYFRSLIATAVIALLLPATAALSQTLDLSDTGQQLDGIVALVNDGVVLRSELNDQTKIKIEELIQQGDQEALTQANQLITNRGQETLNAAKSAVFRNLEDVKAWWNDMRIIRPANWGVVPSPESLSLL